MSDNSALAARWLFANVSKSRPSLAEIPGPVRLSRVGALRSSARSRSPSFLSAAYRLLHHHGAVQPADVPVLGATPSSFHPTRSVSAARKLDGELANHPRRSAEPLR